MDIKNNIQFFEDQAKAAGAQLVVVGKTQPPEMIKAAYDAGHRIFGENKVQEMTEKYEVLPRDIEWHMIGHLQSNKVKYIAPFVSLIHSVDSFRLLEEIDKQGKKLHRVIRCLLQLHIATEETKFGLDEQELSTLIHDQRLESLENVKIVGLMGMASFTDNQDQVRSEFRKLKKIFSDYQATPLPANVSLTELSMGMSSDYKIALEEGSTLIRIGTAIFGPRHP